MNTRKLKFGDLNWSLVTDPASAFDPGTPTIWPMSRWHEIKKDEFDQNHLAIWLEPQDEPETISGNLHGFRFIALQFPSYRDGRAYSSATVIRRHFGYAGPIIAFGDIRPDEIEQMNRCGFDYFWTAEDKLLGPADVKHFSHHYQSAVGLSKSILEASD